MGFNLYLLFSQSLHLAVTTLVIDFETTGTTSQVPYGNKPDLGHQTITQYGPQGLHIP